MEAKERARSSMGSNLRIPRNHTRSYVRLCYAMWPEFNSHRGDEWRRPAAAVPPLKTDQFLRTQMYPNSYVWIQTELHVRRDIIFTSNTRNLKRKWLHHYLPKPSNPTSATRLISIVLVRNGNMCYVGVSDILVVIY